jgi:site-specific recombinase XerD
MLQEMITAKELMTMDKGSTPLSLAARIFLLYNQSEGKATRTQEWYRLCMDRLILDFGPTMPVRGISHDALRVHIFAYQEKAHSSTGKPLMESTINNHVRGIRRFFKWCYFEGSTQTQPLGRYKPPKVPERMAESFKEEEMQRIVDAIPFINSCGKPAPPCSSATALHPKSPRWRPRRRRPSLLQPL